MPVPQHSIFYRPDALPATQIPDNKQRKKISASATVFIRLSAVQYHKLFEQLFSVKKSFQYTHWTSEDRFSITSKTCKSNTAKYADNKYCPTSLHP